MSLFSKAPLSFLGVDIGDSSIKMVELVRKGKRIYLKNYAFSETKKDVKFTKIEDVAYLAKAIQKIHTDSKIISRRVTASLPTFAVFSSIITLSGVDPKNLHEAVLEEARKVIPLPLDEMKIDYKVITDSPTDKKNRNLRVFLTCSPRKIVRKYIDIFRQAGMELSSLETETFSLVRSLVGNDKSTTMIVEIGANSTDISVVRESIPVLNRSLEICASTLTQALADSLGMTFQQAEQLKMDLSLSTRVAKDAAVSPDDFSGVIIKALSPIISEIKYLLDFYNSANAAPVEKIVLSGGGALLGGLPEYLSNQLNLQVIIGDSFNRVLYPNELRPIIHELGPSLAVAVGLALREVEQ
ncbi:type IV pilus assembly protein PilM [Candidatus Falkowbacteria bacterium]|jgi:type IV pilus assembly protein PilM|nr:type IV pilus assembly protein PilM [Patescibacteria group bacterium]MDD3435404.1 type IV pilus assembly protein PilM [Patescibacteria group bacterium]MDD4466740.1 type IV pilus assembly protein PilM [Patescibacteria group bacterium]NCU43212.1 type IV pilus assembly protein PilM [Candidatus Falkowbacteria bacterium]